jgi:hypothetical protein
MAGLKRFVIGGIGGLAPVIAFVAAIDVSPHLSDMTNVKALGHAVKVLLLFAIGGFVAWLHVTEDEPFKLFEIGLGGPALIAGVIATNTIAQSSPPQRDASFSVPAAAHIAVGALAERLLGLVAAPAHAQAPSAGLQPPAAPRGTAVAPARASTPVIAKQFAPPPQSHASQFLEGLTGIQPEKRWFVIAGSYAKPEEALAHARQINAAMPAFKAEVYAPSPGKQYYGVVLGAQLSSKDAADLRNRALQAGLPADTFIKSFGALH